MAGRQRVLALLIQRYRLPREAIRQLLGAIRQDLRRATRRSFALTPQVQPLAALRFYATGSFLQVVGDGQGLCKASVCRSFQAVTYSLLRLVPRHVRFHSRDEMGATQENLFRSFHIPQVAGVVDGTLIPILTPHVDGHVYICRKGYAAVNCQVVCDHQGIILDVVARWPGSTHDSFVFLANPGDVHEEQYNEAHRLARCIVERTIERWKLRFRCLHTSGGGLQFAPAKSCAVICMTAMFHNIAAKAGVALGEPDEDEEESFEFGLESR
ncbi:putative nuclease HARBI1 [Gadus morhua]|uniref:putative nuclease HARBI1 n=1 Tax=Gadus morhua TaxID=8049 RepID=UPI0011B85144|nr:putative nuclease HARBI1 [Gadus morhua]